MARWRFVAVVGLLLIWTAIPALACLPNTSMTQAEMACCKKMAGNCTMGTADHPCCKTLKSAPSQESTVARGAPPIQLHVISAELMGISANLPPQSQFVSSRKGLPPPAPPGLNAILRI
jgi:hypothetical protein